jgi:predicted RNA-binding Zn-ribbon protein involved in translation (DUF1610 family)
MGDETYSKCACQHCNGRIEFPAEVAGSQVTCPHCGQETMLTTVPSAKTATPSPRAVAKPKSAHAPAPPPEPHAEPTIEELAAAIPTHTIRCGSCGMKVAKSDRVCPNCGAVLRKWMSAFRWTGGVIVLALLVWLPFTLLESKKEKERRSGPTRPDLELTGYSWRREVSGDLYYVGGSLVNNSDRRYGNVMIEFDLVDKNGKVLGTVSDFILLLEPHRAWSFKALALDPEAVNAKLKGFTSQRMPDLGEKKDDAKKSEPKKEEKKKDKK